MKRYGLIGFPLTHSFSKNYFAEKFQREKIPDCVYENFPLSSIDQLPELLEKNADLAGLNVTIPYKESVIPFLHEANDIVKQTGACNCISIKNRRLKGYNTDVIGFSQSLESFLGGHKPEQALILGTGGAAKAVGYVLEIMQIPYKSVSRTASGQSIAYSDLNAEMLASCKLIVNTTPLGMYPHSEEYPPIPYEGITKSHFLFDLIYNPAKTLFLQKGEARNAAIKNGWEMLVLQAEESWKIWNEG